MQLHLMGAFTLEVDGTRVHLGRREERLLAFLAMHGPCHRPFVAGSLWPNSDEARALSNLRAAVLKVRRAASDVLEVDGSMLTLSESVGVDLMELVESVEQIVHHESLDGERAEHLLGSGVLLPGWYDDWVMFERERLHHRRVRALELLAALELEAGHADLALAAARDAVALEPLRESAHRLLIRAHLALGNRALAVTVLARYRRDLARDLHIEPSPEILQEVREGLGKAPQPTAPVPVPRDSR
jgi:DNA-binding SARP family transcriptional activator